MSGRDWSKPIPQPNERRAMFARFAGKCQDCGQAIVAGDPIFWGKGLGTVCHPCQNALGQGGFPRTVGPEPIGGREGNQALLDERWAIHRANVAAGQPTRAGVWAEMLVLAKRLGDEATAEVAADEMRRAIDRQTTR